MNRLDKGEIARFVSSSMKHLPEKAVAAVMEKRLMKLYCKRGEDITELHVFYGKERSYIMIPGLFCGCKDFELNVVLRGHRGACYHLVSLELARSQNELKALEVSCETLRDVALELLLGEDSSTLRKIVLSQQPSSRSR